MEVSIHILSGSANFNSMKLLGRIGNSNVEILVDSRSTHNFLDLLVVQTFRLHLVTNLNMQVQVANGKKICTIEVFVKSLSPFKESNF